MSKKKLKTCGESIEVLNQLLELSKQEEIVHMQKNNIYLHYLKYKKLYKHELTKNEKLLSENKKLYQRVFSDKIPINYENNSPTNDEDTYGVSICNDKENICNKKNTHQKHFSDFDTGETDENNMNNHLFDYENEKDADNAKDCLFDRLSFPKEVDFNLMMVDNTDELKRSCIDNTQRKHNSIKDHSSLVDIIVKLKKEADEKDRRIIDLENKSIKYQIISTSKNNTVNSSMESVNDEILSLRTELECFKLKKERETIFLNSQIEEYKEKASSNERVFRQATLYLTDSLEKVEALKKVIKENDILRIEKVHTLKCEIDNLKNELKNSLAFLDQIYFFMKELFKCEKQNKETIQSLKENLSKIKVYERKKDTSNKGDSFYEAEINNMLEYCDNLTMENKNNLEELFTLREMKNKLDADNSKLKYSLNALKEKNELFDTESRKYEQKICELNQKIKELIQTQKRNNEEISQLNSLNIERINTINGLKKELKSLEIENTTQLDLQSNLDKCFDEIKDRIRKSYHTDEDSINRLLICNLCDSSPKNTAITTCMHIFCGDCVELRIKHRNRKCPTCGTSFGAKDVKKIYI